MVAGLVLLDDVAGIWGWPGELLVVCTCACVLTGEGGSGRREMRRSRSG